MPKYINAEGRIIHASLKAYKVIFKEQGYKPFKDIVAVQTQSETTLPVKPIDDSQMLTRESLDTMEYADIKELAKNMDIPRYANTKKADLIELILEKQDGCENQE